MHVCDTWSFSAISRVVLWRSESIIALIRSLTSTEIRNYLVTNPIINGEFCSRFFFFIRRKLDRWTNFNPVWRKLRRLNFRGESRKRIIIRYVIFQLVSSLGEDLSPLSDRLVCLSNSWTLKRPRCAKGTGETWA